MRTLDRSIAIVSIAIGMLLLAASLSGGWGGNDRGMLIFLAIDCIFFSFISALFPRTNAELTHDARELGRFALLSVSILGFIAVSGYLLAGAPSSVPEELFVAIVVFGLPAALILPLVLKRLFSKCRQQQTSK